MLEADWSQHSSSSCCSTSSMDDGDCCWICLAEGGDEALHQVCKCPRRVHAACLARWQLHSAGKDEESRCRFCDTSLQDWRPVITEATGSKLVTPYMRVSFNGKTHKVAVRPGEDGAREFEREIRRLLQLPEDQEFDVIFHCRAPGSGDKLQLQGLKAYDAAVHCASLSSKPTASAANHGCSKSERRSFASRMLQRLYSNLRTVM